VDRLRRLLRIVMGVLREIGDESAYRRHLESCGAVHSGEEWRRFCERRLRSKYARAKCC
jgi:hypothetical protein